MHKFTIILGILMAPLIFSCGGRKDTSIQSEIDGKMTNLSKEYTKRVKCTLLWTKTTKLSAVNINIGCFEKGTGYIHAYVVVDESNMSTSIADASVTLADFFKLRKKLPKPVKLQERNHTAGGKKLKIMILRLEGPTLAEILQYPGMKSFVDNL